MAITRVVDDNVQPTEMVVGPFDGAKRRLAARDIQSQRQQSAAVLRLEVVERAWVTRGGGDAVAALQRRLRPLATEAARSTGYEPCLVSHRAILVTRLRDRLPASACPRGGVGAHRTRYGLNRYPPASPHLLCDLPPRLPRSRRRA